MSKEFSFKLKNTENKARRGEVVTAHGTIQTPAFMPVGTAATVKGMKFDDVKKSGAEIILGNTYHLMLRPTAELIEQLGGLHKFMNWNKPILTDSGGFQVMSLSKIRKISDEGVEFSSHIDGSKHFVSPERSIEIQHKLGSDITMIFDECVQFPATFQQAKDAMERSLLWAQRSKNAFKKREGDKPRYLMGVGKPSDIVGAVLRGVDMFDCVMPTRSGRTGQAFTRAGTLNIRNAKYKTDEKPLDENCKCYACQNHSRAYLHHLDKAQEMLAPMLISEHNIFYYQDLMREIGAAIEAGKFSEFARDFLAQKDE